MNTIHRGDTIRIGDYAITPVEHVTVHGQSNAHGLMMTCAKTPVGIIVESNDKQWAIDINGQTLSIDKLMGDERFGRLVP